MTASWTVARPGPVGRLGVPLTVFLAVVVIAAGATGVALLALPGATERFLSWQLGPDVAAALIGGLYLASAVVFGVALTVPMRQVRRLCVAVLGPAVPTLVLSFVHDEVFDLGRWQALVWFGLFITAPVSMTALLIGLRHRFAADERPSPRLERRSWGCCWPVCGSPSADRAYVLVALDELLR